MKENDAPVLGYILKGYPRISETFIANEILLLEQLGFTVSIFPMRQPRENFCHDTVKKIKAEVHYLPTDLLPCFWKWLFPNLLLAARYPRRYLKTLSVALKRFSRTGRAATFKHLFQAGYLVNNHLLKNMKIDHLHGHFAHSPTSVTFFASLLSDIPFSFTAHAKDIYTSDKRQLREKIANAGFVITCTAYNAVYLAEIAGDISTPIHCIYHGIDTRLFSSEGAAACCTPPYSLLTVARLTAKKGLPTLYQTLAILKKQGVAFKHTLIGDGDDREAILALIEELGLQSDCQWLGTLTHEEVLQHFRKSDLFLLACEIAKDGDRDGIPNVLVESLAMGVPVISTDVSAIPELIRHRSTGIIVPPGNSGLLAEAVMELLTDTTLRRTIITEGQLLVKSHFDNQDSTLKLAEIFKNATGGRVLP